MANPTLQSLLRHVYGNPTGRLTSKVPEFTEVIGGRLQEEDSRGRYGAFDLIVFQLPNDNCALLLLNTSFNKKTYEPNVGVRADVIYGDQALLEKTKAAISQNTLTYTQPLVGLDTAKYHLVKMLDALPEQTTAVGKMRMAC